MTWVGHEDALGVGRRLPNILVTYQGRYASWISRPKPCFASFAWARTTLSPAGRWHERTGTGVKRNTHEVVGRSIANIEKDRGIELRQIDQIRGFEVAILRGGFAAKASWRMASDVASWRNAKGLAFVREGSPFEDTLAAFTSVAFPRRRV